MDFDSIAPADLGALPVGSRVYATRATGVCAAREPGLVLEAYSLGGRQGRSILFERGGWDGFSAQDAALMLLPEGSADPSLAAFAFRSVSDVEARRRRGEFDFEFPRSFEQAQAAAIEAALAAPDPGAAERGRKPRV